MQDREDHQSIILSDGRKLGYSEYGDPDGSPVVYFHGFPGSRLDWLIFDGDDGGRRIGIRIIAVDRPGYGLSDPLPKRSLLDWPDDVGQLADSLGFDRFAVLGISGGGPFAAACAFKLSDRLSATGIVCGMGPADAPGARDGVSWTLPGKPGPIRRFIIFMMAFGLRKDPDRFLAQSLNEFPEVDQAYLNQADHSDRFLSAMQEAFRNGRAGAVREAAILARPWGFQPEEIDGRIQFWHGDEDLNVPISVGRHLADRIPGAVGTFLPGEGHLTIMANRIEEVLTSLKE